MIKFNLNYFLLAVTIFTIEIFIEKSTGFIRYTLGDFFAVIFVYALIKTTLNISVLKASLIALLIAFGIEFLQLLNLHKYYPTEYKKLFGLILGSSFSIEDLVAYSAGIVLTVLIEYRIYIYRHNLNKD